MSDTGSSENACLVYFDFLLVMTKKKGQPFFFQFSKDAFCKLVDISCKQFYFPVTLVRGVMSIFLYFSFGQWTSASP